MNSWYLVHDKYSSNFPCHNGSDDKNAYTLCKSFSKIKGKRQRIPGKKKLNLEMIGSVGNRTFTKKRQIYCSHQLQQDD